MMAVSFRRRSFTSAIRRGPALLVAVTFVAPRLLPQEAASTLPGAPQNEPSVTLRVQKNVVVVRAVVRDSHGRAVGELKREDFKVFDNGKLQQIGTFAVETPPAAASSPQQPLAAGSAARAAVPNLPGAAAVLTPLTYLAFYFDDLNSAFDSVVRSREAAERFLAGLPATERVAIFTSSGTQSLDFTGDRQKLDAALLDLHPVKRLNPGAGCPQITDYLASQIVNLEDPDAYRIVRDQAINECQMDARSVTDEMLRMQAQAAYDAYVMEARADLENLDGVIERIALMPGERQVMLVSDGFMPLEMGDRVELAVDHAVRARVIISALDGSGLAVRLRVADASQHYAPAGDLANLYNIYDENRESAATGTLAEIAEGTGGQFFHNNNDLLGGLRQILAPPEVSYVLTFSPPRLKYNGAFHILKVRLVSAGGLTVQARKGYFAPKQREDPELVARQQIHDAVFSQESIQDLPLRVSTKVRPSGASEEISVQAQLDIRNLPFQQRNGRSLDRLTFTVALFDRDGKFVSGSQQNRSLALKGTTLADLGKSGLGFQAHVWVKAGAYTVRVVVRESQGGQMAALTRSVDLPL